MDKKILIATTVIIATAILITPVMAIGPFNALDVGNNKNLEARGPAVVNHRGGEGGGVNFWMMGASGEHWVKWEFQDAASQAKGLMNNAIIAEYSGPMSGFMPYIASLADTYENKWIYLSSDGEDYPGQYNGHGMLWWFMFAVTYATKYAEVYAQTGNSAAANAAGIAAGTAAGNDHVAEHPQGSFWKTNEISGSLP